MCNAWFEDRISANELRTRLKLNSMNEFRQDKRLPLFGHLQKKWKKVLDLVNVQPSWSMVVSPEDYLRKHGMR